MKKLFSENIIIQLIFLSLVVFLSRLPFLWAGYGSEEDAWLLPLTAKNIALNGIYEMSRAPGHPLQELIYSLMWNAGPFAYNLISAIASVIAVVFFALSLKNLNFKHYLFAAFAFAFTPIIFISSTYTIDYMLAMAFVMGSFYLASPLPVRQAGPTPLQKERGVRREVLAAVFLGLAIGFRLTSAAMLIPFCILLFSYNKSGLKKIILFTGLTIIIGMLTYIPVIKTYGFSFFTYSDQFPYPNIPKVFFKATIGVFGLIGVLAIIIFSASPRPSPSEREEERANSSPSDNRRLWVSTPSEGAKLAGGALILSCITVILIYILSYLRLPQKSAYFIPAVPFIILMFGYYLSGRAFKIFCVLLTMSSFFFSVNLTDPLRGSEHSSLAMQFKAAGQKIFIDPLTGPVFSDYTKRLNKIAFTEQVYQRTIHENRKTILICGWWYNELLVRNWNNTQNMKVLLVFYINKSAMEKYISEGYTIYYLPEQNLYNDQFSQMSCTDSFSKPYF